MIPIKLTCACGQRYAFDIEPVEGRMPHSVACPVCQADGTPAANGIIAQTLARSAPAVREASGGLRLHGAAAETPIAAPAETPVASPSGRRPALLPGQLPREQALNEARAKMMWGDDPQQVLNFLLRNNYERDEASELVAVMRQERLANLRSDGIKKIGMGIGLVLVPIVAYFFFASIGYLPLKILAVTVMVGLYGAYQTVQGIFMLVAPKAVRGDAAEQ